MTAGRPTVMTTDIIAKLEEAFLHGASDKEACSFVGIGNTTLYDYCQANPEFSERKEALKDMIKYRARVNISEAITKGDKTLSQWYLERKVKDEFSQKTETDLTSKGESITIPQSEALAIAKKYEQEIKKGL